MSQNSLALADALFPAMLTELQATLKALSTLQSGATAPTLTSGAGPNALWADSAVEQIKQRDNADTAWFIRDGLARNPVRTVTTTSDTLLASDAGGIITISNASAVAVTVPQATSNFGAGYRAIYANLGVGAATLTPTTSTINGAATLVLQQGESALIWSDGTNWSAVKVGIPTTVRAAITLSGAAVNEAQGADIASASTIDLDAATGNLVDVTGTTGITAITLSQGRERVVRFTDALTLTHGASLVLPGGANITTAAGDFAVFRGYASSIVRCVAYTRAAGTPVTGGMPRGYLAGLTLSNNGTDATNDIDIASGAARDGDNAADLVLASALTKRLDAAWAVGTNQGGLDTGSIANTTYHVWLIGRSDTGVVDVLFSTSATSPTMPTNYDQKRRIGSIMRVSAAIVLFSQKGDEFLRLASILDVNAANPGTSAVTRTLSVPAGVQVDALVTGIVHTTDTGTRTSLLLTSLDQTDQAPSDSVAPLSDVSNIIAAETGAIYLGSAPRKVRTNTSAQIRSRLSGSTANVTLRIATHGWIDRRGRDD